MEIQQQNQTGSLNISEKVIRKMAQLVVQDIDAVYALASLPVPLWERVLLGRSRKPSVSVKAHTGVVYMDIHVILHEGFSVKEAAEEIQEYVKDAVQNMVSVTVSKVNVFVDGMQVAPKKTMAD